MGLPWKAFLASSAGAAMLLASLRSRWSTLFMAGIFVKACLVQFSGWVVYSVLLYPHFLSPLIGLPEPDGSHWLMGQFKRISKETTGMPMLDWYAGCPYCVLHCPCRC